MTDQVNSDLVDEIESLVSDYLAADKCAPHETIHSNDVDVEEILRHGAYPASDPRSEPAAALMRLADRLKADGGNARLNDVLDAYRAEYGSERAATLNARWQYLAEQ
ncbi:hypothetical protein [Qipengyuania spongiae]|uniref:Uncharacterized protein n=1 Tax=Qipengyuania spongiae TaxID=2909673 RepID=A0ABY5SW74_9SPHN|nr:hypothetical protein [Qipengyuania spongiae]UVI38807.1 hypothetical protein L1F33_11205 [Qipengyuania spongiae]